MNIKIKSEKIIKPSSPTPTHLLYLPASLLDLANYPTLTPLIFFYSKKNGITNKNVMDRLKKSLPNALSVFYPLAGRLDQDGNHFICNDEGVPYVEAAVDKPLLDVVHKYQVCDLDKLLPFYGQQQKQGLCNTLLAIQVNSFACGGLAIGVNMNHVFCDAYGQLLFVKAWASMAVALEPLSHPQQTQSVNNNNNNNNPKAMPKSSYPIEISQKLNGRPCFELWKVFPPPPPGRQVKDKAIQLDNKPVVTKWFMFSEAMLNSLRSKLISFIDTDNKGTSYVDKKNSKSLAMVLSAFIYRRVNVVCHNVNDTKGNIPREVLHRVSVSPLLIGHNNNNNNNNNNEYYFGNVSVSAIAKPCMVGDKEDEWLCMDDFIKSAEKSMEKTVKEMKEGKEESVVNSMKEEDGRRRKGEVLSMGFSNMRGLPVYEADFGWGKPIWVTFGSNSILYKDIVVLINAGPHTKDVVAYVCLSPEDMLKLESDAEFCAAICKLPSVNSKL